MKEKLEKIELTALIIIMLTSISIGVSIHSIIKASGVDAYISLILSFILSIPFVMMFLIIFNYEPDLPMPQKMTKLYGEKIGICINTIFTIIAFIIGSNLMYNLVSFIESQFLYNTPPFVIGIAFLIVIIYINIKGIETISRVAFILIVINIFLFLIQFFALMPNIQIDNFKPVLEYGFDRVLNGAIRILSINFVSVFIISIIPKNKYKNPEKTNKAIIIGFILSMIIFFSFMIMTIGNLGINLASLYQYPEYMVLKRINLFNFLNRIENVIALQWLNGIFIATSLTIYFVANNIKKNNQSKLLTTILSILMLVIALKSFRSNTDFNYYTYNILPIIRIFSIIPLIITALLIAVKKKKNKLKIFS